jgi:hypothetical protein
VTPTLYCHASLVLEGDGRIDIINHERTLCIVLDMFCSDFVVSIHLATAALSRSCFAGINRSSPMLPTTAKTEP